MNQTAPLGFLLAVTRWLPIKNIWFFSRGSQAKMTKWEEAISVPHCTVGDLKQLPPVS